MHEQILAALVWIPSHQCWPMIPSRNDLIRLAVFPFNFCLMSSRRSFGRGWQVQTGSIQVAFGTISKQDQQNGWPPKSTPPTRNNQLPCSFSNENWSIQKIWSQQPRNNLKNQWRSQISSFAPQETHRGSSNKSHQWIDYGFFLFLIKSCLIHASWKRTMKDATNFGCSISVSLQKTCNITGRIESKERPCQCCGTGNQQLEKWLVKADSIAHALYGTNICWLVWALVLQVLDLLCTGTKPDSLLCTFQESIDLPCMTTHLEQWHCYHQKSHSSGWEST